MKQLANGQDGDEHREQRSYVHDENQLPPVQREHVPAPVPEPGAWWCTITRGEPVQVSEELPRALDGEHEISVYRDVVR